MDDSRERDPRRTFGRTVLAGLAGGLLAAVAGNQPWARAGDGLGPQVDATPGLGVAIDQATAPLVTALALVLLATWGVVLVTRGLFRRIVAWTGLLAGVGVLVSAVATFFMATRAVSDTLEIYVASGTELDVDRTWWSWLGVAAGLLAFGASVVAVRSVSAWPEMGRRYDAPGDAGSSGAAVAAVPLEEQSSIDLWKAMDEGHDPTDPPTDLPGEESAERRTD